MELEESAITVSKLTCKYCYNELEGESDSDVIIKLIYHIHDNHIDEEEEDPYAPGGRLD